MEMFESVFQWWVCLILLVIVIVFWRQLRKWSKWGKAIHEWIRVNCPYEVPEPIEGAQFAVAPRPPMPQDPGWP